ncbi:MAG: serine/threonine-protein kinase [Planctomycetota bacterium]|nr:serine/threonine-protein kinase [Planctomycetota bacterium]
MSETVGPDTGSWEGSTHAEETPADRVRAIGEEFLDRLRAGESPDRAALVASHPEIAKELDHRLKIVEALHGARLGGDPPPGTSQESPLDTPGLSNDLVPAQLIGPYRICEKLGEGGMAVVYLAEQTEPVRRQVALKVIKLGMASEEIIGRFEMERQALALMDHPGISKIFDAGATGEGRPYFVMEYVAGEPITKYCDRRRLPTSDRLRLFQQVCEAVQHAHQKGIIHRDLKPSNILVAGNGTHFPKIIDFGIAKATDRTLAEMGMQTEMGRIIGTPEYMSPEQASGKIDQIDTRTDVYSLGALLYEILVGAPPFEFAENRGAALEEIGRRIRDDQPEKPSTRVSTLGERSTRAARMRLTEPRSLARLLRGDLDWITKRAMEKEPDRRYRTASELAADIDRYLKHEPVLATSPSVSYLLWKFVRRHPAAASATLTLGMALIVGIAIGTVMSLQLLRARQDSVKEGKKVRAVNEFLQAMFAAINPVAGSEVKVSEILDHASTRIDAAFSEYPEGEADVRNTIGAAYMTLGFHDKAEPHLKRGLEIRREVLGWEHEQTIESMSKWALLRLNQGRFDEAGALLREAVRVAEAILGEEHPTTLGLMSALSGHLDANVHDSKAAIAMGRRIAGIRRRVLGEMDPRTLASVQTLALMEGDTESLSGAVRLLRKFIENSQGSGDTQPSVLISTMHGLVHLLERQGNLDEAEAITRDLVLLVARQYGEESWQAMNQKRDLANLLKKQGDYHGANRLLRELLASSRADLEPGHPLTIDLMRNLESLLEKSGETAEALSLRREIVEIRRTLVPRNHPSMMSSLEKLAKLLRNLGESAEAEKLYRELMETSRTFQGPEHPDTLSKLHGLAHVVRDRGNPAEAERLLRDELEIRRRLRLYEHERLNDITHLMKELAETLDEQGRGEEAEDLLQAIARSAEEDFGETHLMALRVQRGVAQWLRENDRVRQAEAIYRHILEVNVPEGRAERFLTLRASHWLGHILLDRGEAVEAEPFFRTSYDLAVRLRGIRSNRTDKAIRDLKLCLVRLGKYGKLVQLYLESIRLLVVEVGEEYPRVLDWTGDMALTIGAGLGDLGKAIPLYRAALEKIERVRGPGHPKTLEHTALFARLLNDWGELDEAQQLFEAVMDLSGSKEHEHRIRAMLGLARVLHHRGKFEEAESRYREALEAYESVGGGDTSGALRSIHDLGRVLVDRGKGEMAEPLLRQVIQEPGHPDLAVTRIESKSLMAAVLSNRGETVPAEALAREAAEAMRTALPVDHWRRGEIESNHGWCLLTLGRHEEAEALLRQSHDTLSSALIEGHPRTRRILLRLVTLYEDWSRPEQAAHYQALLDSSSHAEKRD